MKQHIKDSWCAALRSGDYIQGDETLKHVDDEGLATHCCLGVLTELYAVENGIVFTGIESELKAASDIKDLTIPNLHSDEYLCPAVMEWAGLDRNDPAVYGQGVDGTLAAMNDSGYSFEQIADVIEAQL
jgi:hypothetical protein